jgi:hypothetical protein
MSSTEHVIRDIEQQLDCKVKIGQPARAKSTPRKRSGEGDSLPVSKRGKYSESTDGEPISSTNIPTTDPYYGRVAPVHGSYGSSQYYAPPSSSAQYPEPTDPYYGRVDPLPEDTYITPTYNNSDSATSRSAALGPNTSSLDDSSNIDRSIQ